MMTPPFGRRARDARGLRLLLALVLLVTPLLLAEAAVRTLVAADRLPDAPAYERPFEVSWHNYHAAWPVDILIVGDSMAAHSIPPAAIDDWMEAQTGRRTRTFNLGSSGADYAVTSALVQELASEGRLPPIVLIALTPPSLTGKDTYQTAFAPSPMGSRIVGCGWATSLDDRLSCELSRISDAWAWRGEPNRLLDALVAPMPTSLPGPGSPLEADGYRPGTPATDAILARDVAELDANPGAAFQLGPRTKDDVLAMVRTIRSAGSAPIGFSIPLAPPLVASLERRHPGWDTERQQAIEALTSETGMVVADIDTFGSWWKPDDSRDPIHLSRLGAPLFVRQLLARDDFGAALHRAVAASASR